jgi:pimeloyl-ACP methyl ester carboxylesterase
MRAFFCRERKQMMTLVLLPGMDGTGTLFAGLIKALGADIDVVVVSYPVEGPQDYATLERVARARLPQDRPYLLLGESFSGPIAIAIAASRPPGLAGLVLCCTFARNPYPALAVFKPLVGWLPFKLVPLAVLSFFLIGAFATEVLRRDLQQALAGVSSRVLQERTVAVLSVDAGAQLHEITAPRFYFAASRDRVVPASSGRLITALPGWQQSGFAAPHFLLQSCPALAAEAIRRIMREIEKA